MLEASGFTGSRADGVPREREVPELFGKRFGPLEISLSQAGESSLFLPGERVRPDFFVAARWRGKEFSFVAEYKSSSTPRTIEMAIYQARRYAEASQYLPMLIVPYLSPDALDRLAEEEVSGIDLSGNGMVVVPGEWFIRSTGAKNHFPTSAPIKNVYRGTSSLVARVFFSQPRFSSVQEILGEIQRRGGKATLSTVSKALSGLEEDLLIGRERAIRLLQPERLLDRLLDNHRAPVGRSRRTIRVTDRQHGLLQFADNARQTGASVIGYLPSRYVVMPGSEDIVRVYASSIEEITRGVELEENSRFPNMELVETEEQAVYFDPVEDEGFLWTSPLQTYLMLASGDKREREVAQQLRPDLVRGARGDQDRP